MSLAILIVVLLGCAAIFVIRSLGKWLAIEDPCEPACCVVVLGGHVPFRPMEAAAIFKAGWAPEIWIARFPENASEIALRPFGVEITPEFVISRRVLEVLGVPEQAMVVLEPSRDTREEMDRVYQRLSSAPQGAVILVTSGFHGRRVKATWKKRAGSSRRAIVRTAKEDSFHPDRWFFSTTDLQAVFYELCGLINVWLGYPLRKRT